MERVLKIPKFLAHLKTYGGYPVPFTQLWASGMPDFRAADMEHCARCLRDKLCAICGRRLGEYCYFIGGPRKAQRSLRRRAPFLLGEKWDNTTLPKNTKKTPRPQFPSL